MRGFVACSVVLWGLSLTGCGDPDTGRVVVTGSIKHIDNPQTKFQRGTIQFVPAPGTTGTPYGPFAIKDGRYEMDTFRGPMAGKYTCRIELPPPAVTEKLQPFKKTDEDEAQDERDLVPKRWQFPNVVVPDQREWEKNFVLDDEHFVENKSK